jgi:putative methyltransferase (TIGR04325 family)
MAYRPITAVKQILAHTPLGTALKQVPYVERAYTQWAFSRKHAAGLFAGIYDSYAAALAAIPPETDGWDSDRAATFWLDDIAATQPCAYASFFWLSKLLTPGSVLVDWGGSIGVSYYGFVRRAQLPEGVRWIVVELPKLAEQGQHIAQREAARGLEFATDLAQAPRTELLFSAGAIQYMPDSVPGLFEYLGYRPRHVLLNKVPLTEGREYWSVQNNMGTLAPYRIYAQRDFLNYFVQSGYALRDRWDVPELEREIVLHPDEAFRGFHGLLFERQDR